jgi:anthranilate phosphoribosyltransferase
VSESASGADLAPVIERIASGDTLSAEEAESAFHAIMEGEVSPVQVAGFLVALRTRGVAPSEVAGGVRALRRAMIPVHFADPDVLVDTCGTGGGRVSTFNVSTAAALVAAGAGVPVAKHGNRSFTSRSGSADVLEALGVRIDLTPEAMGEVLERAGIVFMFAPLLHPAMRHVGPVRRELKIATIMNLLGPLTNPAGARRQVVGVADPALVPLVVAALQELGHLRALVVHGEPGMDEVSPLGITRVARLEEGRWQQEAVEPRELGVDPGTVDPVALAGGSPEENAARIEAVLRGEERGAPRTLVLINAAAALDVAGKVDSLREGVEMAEEVLDSGAAAAALDRLRDASRSVVGG